MTLSKATLDSRRFATFVQRVVEKLDTPQLPNDLSPQERVDQAYRMSQHLFNNEGELTDENAVKAAAIIAAFNVHDTAGGSHEH